MVIYIHTHTRNITRTVCYVQECLLSVWTHRIAVKGMEGRRKTTVGTKIVLKWRRTMADIACIVVLLLGFFLLDVVGQTRCIWVASCVPYRSDNNRCCFFFFFYLFYHHRPAIVECSLTLQGRWSEVLSMPIPPPFVLPVTIVVLESVVGAFHFYVIF